MSRYILEITDKTGTREQVLSYSEWKRRTSNLAIPVFAIRQDDGTLTSYRFKEEHPDEYSKMSVDELLKGEKYKDKDGCFWYNLN